jgi:hypothetical protein
MPADYAKLDASPDSLNESSRLAAQIIWLAASNISSHYVFKLTVTTDGGVFKKNDLHWAEDLVAPYDLSDSTLSAEIFCLLSELTVSSIYTVNLQVRSRANHPVSVKTQLDSRQAQIVLDCADRITKSGNVVNTLGQKPRRRHLNPG